MATILYGNSSTSEKPYINENAISRQCNNLTQRNWKEIAKLTDYLSQEFIRKFNNQLKNS